MILDNVSNPGLLQDFWSVFSRGSVIITCRSPETATLYPKNKVLVDSFTIDTASNFVLFLVGNKDNPSERDRELAVAISKAVGNHPLALTMVGSYIRRCGKSMRHFILENPHFERAFMFHPDLTCGVESANERSVKSALALTFQTALPMESHSRLLICMLAFLDPDGAPLEIFRGHTKEAM